MKSGRRIPIALAAGTVLTLMGLGAQEFFGSSDPSSVDPWLARVLAPFPLRFGKDWPLALACAANVVFWGLAMYFVPTGWSFLKLLIARVAKTKYRRVPISLMSGLLSFGLYFVWLKRQWWGTASWFTFLAGGIRYRRSLPTSLVLAECGFALLVQIGAFLLIRWILLRPRPWRFLGLVPFVLFLKFAVPPLVLEQIPLFFLTAKDEAPSRELPLHCELEGNLLSFLRHPVDVLLEEPWLASSRLLQASPCRVVQLDLRVPLSSAAFAIPGGSVVVPLDVSTGHHPWEWWYYGGPGSAPRLLIGSPEDARDHVLSNEGEWVAWFDREDEERRPPTRLVLQSTFRDQKKSFRFSDFPGWPSILSLDLQNDRLVLGVRPHASDGRTTLPVEYYEYGLDGRRHWGPFKPAEGWFGKLRLIRGQGWVAWSEGEAADWTRALRIVWSLGSRHGSLAAHKGRTFNSVDVDADGRFIAVGERSDLPYGRVPDTVFVLDVRTEREVLRLYLPKYSRPVVRFAGHSFFAYSVDLRDPRQPSHIRVFRLPR